MNRTDWLKQIRRETEERYTTIWAPFYGEKWGLYENTVHREFLQKLLGFLPEHAAHSRQDCLRSMASGRMKMFTITTRPSHRSRSGSAKQGSTCWTKKEMASGITISSCAK
jgi:HSP90 family molecular chaperone